MRKLIPVLLCMAINFIGLTPANAEKIQKSMELELETADLAVLNARNRIRNAGMYQWKDALRFLPTVSVSHRGPVEQVESPTSETYLSASISLNQFFAMSDIAEKKKIEKRKAIRKVQSIGFELKKLIERKYLLHDRIVKMKKIILSIEDPLEAAKNQDAVMALEVRYNELVISIEQKFAEIEYVCVDVEG